MPRCGLSGWFCTWCSTASIFLGANQMPNYLTGMTLLIDLAVGLVVACTVYGFYVLFSRGEF